MHEGPISDLAPGSGGVAPVVQIRDITRSIAAATLLCVALVLLIGSARAETIRISYAMAGEVETNFDSITPAVSGDGRYVVFRSGANNLVSGDDNGNWDIFVRDTQTGVMSLASAKQDGTVGDNASIKPAISADGQYVAFASLASNLVADDTGGYWDIFVKELQTGLITRVSTSSSGVQGNNHSESVIGISADGRFVVFKSDASNLVGDDNNSTSDIFIKDRLTNETTRVSVSSAGDEANSLSMHPAVSGGGDFAVFRSIADNLATPYADGWHVFVHDVQTGLTGRVSSSSAGAPADATSDWPVINASGRFVAFTSRATNLVPDHTGLFNDVLVKDLVTNSTTLVSTNTNGDQGDNHSNSYTTSVPSISADGRYVVFESSAANLVNVDDNAALDIFVKDRYTNQTARLSTSSAGLQAGGNSMNPALSTDGRFVVFESAASDLVSDDANAFHDIFRADNLLFVPDTDNDGLRDDQESDIGTNPALVDTDGDGLTDGEEVSLYGTAPLLADTDSDGFSDGDEVAAGSDPLDDTSMPAASPDGDVTGDGQVDTADVLIATRILLDQRPASPQELLAIDVAPLVAGVPAPDGLFTAGDVSLIQQKALGVIDF